MKQIKILEQTEDQDYVITIQQHQNPEEMAIDWFVRNNIEGHVYVNYLFKEKGYAVYECYTDPGSDDYLYVIQSI